MGNTPSRSAEQGLQDGEASRRKKLGAFGEQAAADYLRKSGYRIIARNHRTPLGEVDIIAEHKKTLVFVEVRTRKGTAFGTPQESITWRKQEKLRQLAESYVQDLDRQPVSYRIDVVVVQLGHDGRIQRLELIPNAVEGVGG